MSGKISAPRAPLQAYVWAPVGVRVCPCVVLVATWEVYEYL